jgi:hypothetical protein
MRISTAILLLNLGGGAWGTDPKRKPNVIRDLPLHSKKTDERFLFPPIDYDSLQEKNRRVTLCCNNKRSFWKKSRPRPLTVLTQQNIFTR